MANLFREQIMKATGFTLPDSYLALLDSGRLNFGKSREEWTSNLKAILLNEPPALICSPSHLSVEWLTNDEIAEWQCPDYWKPNRFIAFAGNGRGDDWCWDPERANDSGTPIILCKHDENQAEIFAASFDDFLYRIVVESLAFVPFDTFDGTDDDIFKTYLALNIDTIAPYITEPQSNILRSLLQNDFQKNDDQEYFYLITEDEKNRILNRDVIVGRVGKTFPHMILKRVIKLDAIKS